MHEQTEAPGFETTSVTAAQSTAGEGHTDVDKDGEKMLTYGGSKAPRLLDRD
jgi:hypothetical protein